jgi:hypothetical protein
MRRRLHDRFLDYRLLMFCGGSARRRAGRALTDITVLVGTFGLIAIGNLILSRFIDTGNSAWTLAAILAGGFALESVYGYMAPERKRRRDRAVRAFIQRRRA